MMWFKKLLIKLTIKALDKINAVDYGKQEQAINNSITNANKELNNIIKNWDNVEKK